MKKYITPQMELILFETKQQMMDSPWDHFSGGDTEVPDSVGYKYSVYGTPSGTVVNNNGAPTFVPGGNGGGGRQTPLG